MQARVQVNLFFLILLKTKHVVKVMAILYILCLSINVLKKESYVHKIIPNTLRQAAAAAAAAAAPPGVRVPPPPPALWQLLCLCV